MSEHTISLKPGDTLTIAHVAADDESQAVTVAPVETTPSKGRKQGPRKQKADENEAAYAARVERYNKRNEKPQATVVEAAPDLESLIESAPAPVEDNPKTKPQVPLCKAVAIVSYTSKEGKVSDVVLWKMGKNARGKWFRMRWLDKKNNGFATFRGFWGVKAHFNSVVAQGDDLKQRCGCEDCRKLRKAA